MHTLKTSLVAVLAALAVPLAASAATSAEVAAPAAVSGVTADVAAPAKATGFSVVVNTGLGVAHGGGNVSLGAGYDLTSRINLGVVAEYNPWFDYLAGKAAPGCANAYATASFKWFGHGGFEVRSGLMAGTSVLLFDTPGAQAGSVGVLVGASVLKVGARMSEKVAFEISPDVVLAVPSLRGVPLVYNQFRLSAGIRFGI